MINFVCHRWSAVVILAGLLFSDRVGAETTFCRSPDFPQEVICGKIQRPLNPTDPNGKKIDVHYMVVPSQDRNKLPDAVFLLAGGPGQSAINAAGFGQALLNRLNRRRDLVFVDQRGTGRSAPLQCPDLDTVQGVPDRESMIRLMRECRAQLQSLPYGDLQYFSTSMAMQDLEAVRLAQGYGAINLVGVSYGTRAGLEYLRQFPNAVRRLVIDGVVPPDLRVLGADSKIALDGLFAECAKESRCNEQYPRLEERWKSLLASMPKATQLTHPRLGSPLSITITRDVLLRLVQSVLYSSANTAAIPYALTQAERGNFSPLVTLSGATSLPGPLGIAYGMHFSVWCGEALARPWTLPPRDEFEELSISTYKQVCAEWPRAEIPTAFFNVEKTNSPVLLLSGGIDPVTPTRNGVVVAKALGDKARHVSVENVGHGLLSHGCVRDVVHRFLNAKTDDDAVKVDAACVRQIPRPIAWFAPQEKSVAAAKNQTEVDQKKGGQP